MVFKLTNSRWTTGEVYRPRLPGALLPAKWWLSSRHCSARWRTCLCCGPQHAPLPDRQHPLGAALPLAHRPADMLPTPYTGVPAPAYSMGAAEPRSTSPRAPQPWARLNRQCESAQLGGRATHGSSPTVLSLGHAPPSARCRRFRFGCTRTGVWRWESRCEQQRRVLSQSSSPCWRRRGRRSTHLGFRYSWSTCNMQYS